MNDESKTCPQCGGEIPGGAPQGMCPKCLLAGAAEPTEAGTLPDTRPRPTPPSLQEVTAAFPHLEIIELIGQGGMGFVYRARQPKLERDVALKILPQHLADDPKFAERFGREGKLLAKLNHPSIVSIFDFGESGGFFYLLMEFVDGVNLRQAMQASRFTADQALSIVPKICEALQFAHEEGVLHRDIKPENILLDAKGRIKIADFGIAKMMENGGATFPKTKTGKADSSASVAREDAEADESAHPDPLAALTVAGTSLGTPQYMAPEQIDQPTSVDHRADIYSLGVVFYELLTGELPSGQFAPPSSKTPVDAEVDRVVARALEKQRERRQQSAAELKTQVETLGTGRASDLSLGSTAASAPIPPVLPGSSALLAWQTPAAVSCVSFFLLMTLGTLFASVGTFIFTSPAAHILMMFGCAVAVPIIWWLSAERLRQIEQSQDPVRLNKARFILRSLGIAGLVLSLPVAGFGVFFFIAVLSESGGWHPNPAEALFVPLSWIGSVLLPVCSYKLLQSSVKLSAASRLPRGRLLVGIGMLAIGIILPLAVIGNRSAVGNQQNLARHQETVLTQKAWHTAGQQRFEAQVALNNWKANTVNLSEEEKAKAQKDVGKRLESNLAMAEARVEELQQKLTMLGELRTSVSAPVVPPNWIIMFFGVFVVVAGSILVLFGLRRLPDQRSDSTQNPWPRRIFILIIAIVCVPIGLIVLSLLVATFAYQSVEAPATGSSQVFSGSMREAAFTSTNTMKAIFGDGAIELLAVSTHPDNNQWWRPDGTFIGEVNFETRGGTVGHFDGNKEYEFVFVGHDLPPGSSRFQWELPRSSGYAGGGVRGLDETDLPEFQMLAAAIPEEMDATDVRIGIATGRWDEVHTHDGTRFSNVSLTRHGKNIVVTWPATTRGIETGIVQSMTHNLDPESHQLRVMAILKDGLEKTPGKSGNFGSAITAEFPNIEIENVKGFRLEIREFEWVEFPEVKLSPISGINH